MEVEFAGPLRFLFDPARYKVAYGGRGGAKSWGFARALLIEAMRRKLRVLCARELQVSITDSVHKLLGDQIELLGLGGFYRVGKATIRGRNGSEFIFSGIRSNITKVKSMEGIDICWVEEAEKVSEESWSVLIPTIRKAGSEIWVSFNPHEDTDPTYKRFIASPPPDAKVVKIGWRENPWFPEELRKEKDYLFSVDPEAAAHVWDGETRNMTDAQVLRGRFIVAPFEPDPSWDGPYYGVDWGFAQDPSTMVRVWVDDAARKLYVDHEAYGVGVELDDLATLFDVVPGGRIHISRADNARPETISHLQKRGYPKMRACAKGPGSVEDGVEHLRSYLQIVIHPRCVHTAEEARLWSYKMDRLTGDVLPELVDKHNHCWDAIRYALEPIIRTVAGAGYLGWLKRKADEAKKAKEAKENPKVEDEAAKLSG